jgi:hypothetical protein
VIIQRKNPPRIAAGGFSAKQITLIKTPPEDRTGQPGFDYQTECDWVADLVPVGCQPVLGREHRGRLCLHLTLNGRCSVSA